MAARRQVFRIELMHPGIVPGAAGATPPDQDLAAELKSLRRLIEERSAGGSGLALDWVTSGELSRLNEEAENILHAISRTKQELASLHLNAFNGGGESRAKRELGAIVDSTEHAAQQILDAAEHIDEAVNTLSAGLQSEHDHALAKNIRGHVIHIFEACNFQDLSGQRISKVLATLQFIEERITRMMQIWSGIKAYRECTGAVPAESGADIPLVNGPKLEGDAGHASQGDIDALFD
jgi:chemotaxis protein CheZ